MKNSKSTCFRKYESFSFPCDETFDIGIDTRTSINEKDCQVPFAFNGKMNKLTFNLGPMQLSQADQEKAARAIAIARD